MSYSRTPVEKKWCYSCQQLKAKSEFHRDRSRGDGLNSQCRMCTKVKSHAQYRRDRQLKVGHLERYMKRRCDALRRKAHRLQVSFDLTPKFLLQLYHAQNGHCFYTGLPMQTGNSVGDTSSLSIDRVDPNGGYVQTNVVLCTMFANTLKGTKPQADFIRDLQNYVNLLLAHLNDKTKI